MMNNKNYYYEITNNSNKTISLIRVSKDFSYFRTIAGLDSTWIENGKLNLSLPVAYTYVTAEASHPLIGGLIKQLGEVVPTKSTIKGKHISKEESQSIRDLYAANEQISSLCQRFAVCRATINRHLKKAS
ncbi:MAG: hypothetical protein ACI9L9_001444 [Marivirga sp.]|jgi:hypothetical protein